SKKDPEAEGFQVIPKRWIVERTFAWLSNFRRMSKDYEHSPLTSKTNIFFDMITVMLSYLNDFKTGSEEVTYESYLFCSSEGFLYYAP
ncbi:transposase, partial [Wolbachia endosymbiont of Pentalonia nigronervosa]|nr:transposase [Wolbachia endosymbiont of Pentalonia nigronervosa]